MKENNQYEAMNDLERTQEIKKAEEYLEEKVRIRHRILELQEISKDPYYDQYLAQLLRDLDSEKATHVQVSKEAERTYLLYQQRTQMNQMQDCKKNNNMEFKVGASVFGIVGALFILIAFSTFGLNFLNGMWQGICLYVVSGALLLLSELLIKRQSYRFSLATTGISICGLYTSTIINYLYLETINGFAAMGIILLIAIASIIFSKKKNSSIIRIISMIGCYICLFPIKGFHNELEFMIITVILLIINIVCGFFQNERNNTLINIIHMAVNTFFTLVLTIFTIQNSISHIYIMFFVITTIISLNFIYIKQNQESNFLLKVFYAIELGVCSILLGAIGVHAKYLNEMNGQMITMYYRLTIEVLLIVISILFFMFSKKSSFRWIHYYLAAGTIVIMSLSSHYKMEWIGAVLAVFIVTKLLSKVRELTAFNCIITAVTVFVGISVSGKWHIGAASIFDEWYLWPILAVTLLSILWIRNMAIYHEIVITLFLIMVCTMKYGDRDWYMAACASILLLLFLIYNHLPWTNKTNQQPYNIFNLVIAALFYASSFSVNNLWFSSAMIVTGALAIIIMLRERYYLNLPRKYLILAGFLTYMILAVRFEAAVWASILLMMIALGCVGIGFKIKDKAQRICGLIMAIIVCMKIIVYDFRAADSLLKVVLFLAVGVIALIISYIYIILEKKEVKTEKEKEESVYSEAGVR